MAANIDDVADALFAKFDSRTKGLGLFDKVSMHEPKNAPGSGLEISWHAGAARALQSSGLAETSFLFTMFGAVTVNMKNAPEDDIDRNLFVAQLKLMRAFVGGFTLDGIAREIDVLGEFGQPIGWDPAYRNQDGRLFREFTMFVPVVIDDVLEQAP